MRRYENAYVLFLRHGNDCAYAGVFPSGTGFAEVEIACYKFGHKAEADAISVKGGKLPACARAASGIFNALLAAMRDKWRGQKLFVACPDERRFRVYCAILRKHNVRHESFSAGLSINIYL